MSDPSIGRGPSNEIPILGYDPTTKHAVLPIKIGNVVQDSTTGQWYGVLEITANAGTDLDTSPLALESGGNLAAAKSDLDTLAGIVSGSKAAIKAASGDFVTGAIADLATLLTLAGAPSDANTVDSLMGRLTKIRDLLESVAVNTGTPTETSVSVGVASGLALAANANAKYRAFCNDSSNIIYLAFDGGDAVVGKGIRLNANGGSVMFDRYVPTGAVTAIATGAASNLTVTEA